MYTLFIGYSEKTAGELEYELKKSTGSKYPIEGYLTSYITHQTVYMYEYSDVLHI